MALEDAGEFERDQRNEASRHRRQAQKGILSVYAVWFPVPQVLKVGFTTDTRDSIFVSVARTRARRRAWETAAAACVWKRPGDTRVEAWIQATLAFRWQPAFDQKHNRICEWFQVQGLAKAEVVAVLNEVYALLPADEAG